ncbi:Uncharacterised protein [Ralstonia pickettii]|uniref:helix-turn-helix domain-containing protein n=1 Tax=Ralstonia pickettii TaxID=329 RepID=UPI000503A4FE|nr:helix-turn-helix domain-containing protein [Ralstonia pickettii]KFL18966.1 helix-turn-helix domain protein [Ralstonia pickettii]QQK36978.1 hypothetical protein RP6297_03216 [Ralstonia pickettii]UCA15814.1 helix-turn-helix domain-containing protein [Ralstonia pickettii]SUE01062.1 Uncharacterised protein [Ralstonia pickettii]
MAIKIMSLVWEGYPGGGSDLLAMLALADWSDDNGRCYPSMSSIATKTRLSRSQAQRVVHGLIDSGFVQVIGNELGGAPGATRQYRIVLTKLTGSTNATPTGRTDATGSVHATGSAHAQDGSHGCAETGRMDATQTVIEPSITVKRTHTSKNRPKSANGKIPLPEGFAISEGVRKWAKANGHQNLEAHFEYFIDTVQANGNVYANWDAAFKKAVANDWAGLNRRYSSRYADAAARFEN